jgi:hypothetical protein
MNHFANPTARALATLIACASIGTGFCTSAWAQIKSDGPGVWQGQRQGQEQGQSRLGFKVIDTPATSFNAYGGLSQARDKYRIAQTANGAAGLKVSRSSIYLAEESAHWLSPTVSFKQRVDLYPGLNGDKALLTTFNASLSLAMNPSWSLGLGVNDAYHSKPPAGFKNNDFGVFSSVNVKFGLH